ncbi:MAG: hypothetical protein ACYCW7_15730 [Pseudomonadaceae bacterium]
MTLIDINTEDWLVQETFAEHLHDVLGGESVCAHNTATFGASALSVGHTTVS